jgi:hypothetical protein
MKASTRRAPHNILANLPSEQLIEFTAWLVRDNLTYYEAADKLGAVFDVKVSHETVHQFYKRYCAPEMHKRDEFIRRAVQKLWQQRLAAPPTAPVGGAKTGT